ncbi:type II secretion system minor pseudopilin GspI [Marinicella sp. W31]|uniref:type II secretion system minor pseudopilin GspI n=1 Tax=Marinicella sp. W31 TaxID=3023713 RepID=UPI003756F145
MKNNRAFTLLEVLIALLLVSIALTALVQVGARRADTLIILEEKNLAYQVAHSTLNRLYLQPLEQGIQEGVTDGLNGNWYWQAEIKNTDNERILRIDLQVSDNNSFDYAQAQLTGFAWQ